MNKPSPKFPRQLVGNALLALALTACGGGGSTTPAVTPPSPAPQSISLSLSGSPMLGSAPVTVSASLAQSGDVNWSLGSGNPGTLSATSGGSVNYTPPAGPVSAITPVTITATAAGVSKSVHLALYPDPGAPGLSLLAGSLGGHAIIDGSGNAARFNHIVAMAADSDGSVVVADLGDPVASANPPQTPSTLRRISAAGAVTTLASPAFGHADGPAAAAKLGTVMALAVTADHGLFVIDNDNVHSYVRRIEPDGSVSTVATLSPAANFAGGARLAVDAGGHVMVISQLAVYALNGGTPVLLAGQEQGGQGSVDGSGNVARFNLIGDSITDSAGSTYLIDGRAIRKVTPTGQVSTLAGVSADSSGIAIDGNGSMARFGSPASLALDGSGNLLVLDREVGGGGRSGYLIRQVTPAGVVSTPYAGADPTNYGFAPPTATATPNSLLRVSSSGAIVLASVGQLQVQQDATSARALAGLEGDSGVRLDGQGAAARLFNPTLLAADLSGNVYVLERPQPGGGYQIETGGILLRKITASGLVSTISASSTLVPTGMATDGDGNLYISARWPLSGLAGAAPGGLIYKITPQGALSILAGSQQTGSGSTPVDGTGSAAVLVRPILQGLDADGNLYVNDENVFVTPIVTKVRKITPQGVVTTIAALPAGLNKAPDGFSYSADPDRSVVYRVAADGSKSIAAGLPAVRGTRLGALPGGLDRPYSVVPTGPGSFAVISGAAVLRLVLPH